MVLQPNTNWEKLGGAQRREETPTHNTVLPTAQNPSRWTPSWLRIAMCHQKDPESDQIWAKQDDWPETTWKLTPLPYNLRLWATWQSSSPGFPILLPSTRRPFRIKSFAWSVLVSSWTIHFRMLDRSPLSGPGRVSPFLQQVQFLVLPSHQQRHRIQACPLLETVWCDPKRLQKTGCYFYSLLY